jgi:hypothetical protein
MIDNFGFDYNIQNLQHFLRKHGALMKTKMGQDVVHVAVFAKLVFPPDLEGGVVARSR